MSDTSPFKQVKQFVTQRWDEQVYEKVSDEESDGKITMKDDSWRVCGVRIRSVLAGISIAALMTLSVAGLVSWPLQSQTGSELAHCKAEDNTVYHCGSSIEEARALGCSWDLLAAAWLRPECTDSELTKEFREAGEWQYFADKAGTQELQEDDLQYRVGENQTYFTTLKYHRTHCSFQWRKMHRAMQRNGRIENALASYHHTLHCGFVFLQDGELDELLTEISVEFMYC